MVNFSTWIPDCESHSPALLYLFISSDASICSTIASLISMVLGACGAAIVHRNHFSRLYQQKKSFEAKVKFKQASNRCKRVLEASKLAYANKTKEPIDQLQILW